MRTRPMRFALLSTVTAQLSNFPAPEKNAITMKSLKIGTIQLSRQGVVAW